MKHTSNVIISVEEAEGNLLNRYIFNHNRELSEITQKAHFSNLNGGRIASVRFAYDKAMDEYCKRHMWDDLINYGRYAT